jgi:hypothetical protein
VAGASQRANRNIREDLASRPHGFEREAAAGHWSNVASKQKIELTESGGHGPKPRAVVVITTASGFVLTAVSKPVTGVWHAFNHTPHS